MAVVVRRVRHALIISRSDPILTVSTLFGTLGVDAVNKESAVARSLRLLVIALIPLVLAACGHQAAATDPRTTAPLVRVATVEESGEHPGRSPGRSPHGHRAIWAFASPARW